MWVRFGKQTALMLASAVRYSTIPPTATAAAAAPFATDKGMFDALSAVWLLMPLLDCHCVLICGLAFQVLSDLSHTQQILDCLSEAHLPWAALSLRYDCA